MKVLIAVGSIVLFFESAALAQTTPPTPTLEQCRADYVMWHTEGRLDEITKPLGAGELYQRATIMTLCGIVANSQHAGNVTQEDLWETLKYDNSSRAYTSVLMLRFKRYIDRHSETKQFTDEDAAGQR
jgi:hypothetical protein